MSAELPDPGEFLSGEHGHVAGRRGMARRVADAALDGWLAASGTSHALDTLASRTPVRDVLIATVRRPGSQLVDDALRQLEQSRHRTRIASGEVGHGGKFQNLNALLPDGAAPADWLLVVDDDVALPAHFLDRFVAILERFGLDLAQPAQTLASHAAWRFARRRPFSVLRETNFVEIGPVTAFSRRAAAELLPFPDLRFGWGLDAHWAALAADRGWKLGIVDALPVRHETRPVAAGYAAHDAVEEASRFLSDKPFVRAAEAGRTLRLHRRLPS